MFDFSVKPNDGFVVVWNIKQNYYYGGYWNNGQLTLKDDDGREVKFDNLNDLRWRYDTCFNSGLQGGQVH